MQALLITSIFCVLAVQDHGSNRLADETSPYLLQHAQNPVDWYPWGEEAFESARLQNKPIFLSIGYSTCYWCHVMERESFEDEETARFMNERFINIKIDREEHPDVDDIYMASVRALSGRGGWPMSVVLDPQTLKPFSGGTYFPPEPKHGRKSFVQFLTEAEDVWQNQPDEVQRRAGVVDAQTHQTFIKPGQSKPLTVELIMRTRDQLRRQYDPPSGGFRRGAPKFPLPVTLEFLMEAAWDDPMLRLALLHTLDQMAMGGIYDQVGGGFHRYSTDARWRVPHFEKMLYDNGQLASVYAKAYEQTSEPSYAEVARETLDYVLREMTSKEGAFYSAQDAEVNAREGGSYVWTRSQVAAAVSNQESNEDIAFADSVYNLKETNFVDPHHPEYGAKNVLYLAERPDVLASRYGMTLEAFNERLKRVNKALLAVRDLREQPLTDDKIIVSWNGLMILGFVDGARALDEPRYLEAAERAARFILDNMRREDGSLCRTYRAGEMRIDAILDDYALLTRALIALYVATGDSEWLDEAISLVEVVRRRFGDEHGGGFFTSPENRSDLFIRTKFSRDGVRPTGASVMIGNYIDLYELTGDESFLEAAFDGLEAVGGRLWGNPQSALTSVQALHRAATLRPERFASVSDSRVPGQTNPAAPSTDPSNELVKIETSKNEIRFAMNEAIELEVKIQIAPNHHITAHRPGDPAEVLGAPVSGLQIRLVNGRGLDLQADYPAADTDIEGLQLYHGDVRIPCRVMQTGPVFGDPSLMVIYQVCTDRECLPSVGRILSMKIVPAKK
jgi:hypothetical protein